MTGAVTPLARAVRNADRPFADRAGAGVAHLRIMETTDLHVHVYPYDYYSDGPSNAVGLARIATHVAAARAAAPNSLLFDNGDFLQGNPMGDYIAYGRGLKDGDLHPIIEAMNALEYDAATLGNHEFNYGLDFLNRAVGGAEFPLVSANVATSLGSSPLQDKTLVASHAILDRTLVDGAGIAHPVRIGVIGFAPPQIVAWDDRHLAGRVWTREIVAAARAHVPAIREAGAEIVVALCHSGIGSATGDAHENASAALARVDGIDAILAGHSHLVFPSPAFEGRPGVDVARGTLFGTPAVMAGFWGSHLGVIDLLLARDAAGWRVLAHRVETRPISRRTGTGPPEALVESDADVLATATQAHQETLDYVRRPIGRTPAPLHTYFAFAGLAPSVRLVCAAQAWAARRHLAGGEYEGLPLLSASAPFKAGGRAGPDYYTDVSAGELTVRSVADLYLYPNLLRVAAVTGRDLREWLERAAAAFRQILPDRGDQALLHPDFPAYDFDIIDGLDYEIDLAQPPRYGPDGRLADPGAFRIASLAHGGRPVEDDATFALATNSFRIVGMPAGQVILEIPETVRDGITGFVRSGASVDGAGDRCWRFTPIEGAAAVFDTGPGARHHAAEALRHGISEHGVGEAGFLRFRFALSG